jgi:hypothetical protein
MKTYFSTKQNKTKILVFQVIFRQHMKKLFLKKHQRGLCRNESKGKYMNKSINKSDTGIPTDLLAID